MRRARTPSKNKLEPPLAVALKPGLHPVHGRRHFSGGEKDAGVTVQCLAKISTTGIREHRPSGCTSVVTGESHGHSSTCRHGQSSVVPDAPTYLLVAWHHVRRRHRLSRRAYHWRCPRSHHQRGTHHPHGAERWCNPQPASVLLAAGGGDGGGDGGAHAHPRHIRRCRWYCRPVHPRRASRPAHQCGSGCQRGRRRRRAAGHGRERSPRVHRLL